MIVHSYIYHLLFCRGESFRSEFANISEIRALAPPGTNVMALTATANSVTRANVIRSLDMTNHVVIAKLLHNPNIFYAVLPMPSNHMTMLKPLIDQLDAKGTGADRYLIFCRSYDDILALYGLGTT